MNTKYIVSLFENNDYFSKHNDYKHRYLWTYSEFFAFVGKNYPALVIFWGGEDIPPEYYGEKPVYTSTKKPSLRDINECLIYGYCVRNSIPMVGICRGAQLLCALGGGELWQDVNYHQSDHILYKVADPTDQLMTTSTHHQMMIPCPEMELVAYAVESNLKQSENSKEGGLDKDPEIVWDKKHRALMIQGHPEYLTRTSAFSTYCFELINQYHGIKL